MVYLGIGRIGYLDCVRFLTSLPLAVHQNYFKTNEPIMRYYFYLGIFLMLNLQSCIQTTSNESPLKVTWKLNTNNFNNQAQYEAQFTLTNTSKTPLENKGWTIYFNQMESFSVDTTIGGFKIERVSGYYFKLYPTEAFQTLEGGASVQLIYRGKGWYSKISNVPTGPYIVFDNQSTPINIAYYEILPFPENLNRAPADKYPIPTPAYRYAQNDKLTMLKPSELSKIIPTPVHYETGMGELQLDTKFKIQYTEGLEKEAIFLKQALNEDLGLKITIKENEIGGNGIIQLQTGAVLKGQKEAYELKINPNEGIAITGTDAAGVFYGIQSLRSLIVGNGGRLQAAVIEDAPRFQYRGFHFDVSRNFQSKASVLKILDLMAFYKLNKFHFHITDDEGWRLEIDGLPELHLVGGQRGHTLDEKDKLFPAYGSGAFSDNNMGSGYYTKADFIEILQYAHARHIEVIPEIDLPGHARAAIKAMEARYHKFQARGDSAKAVEYLLTDFEDKSEYSTAQYYTDNVICVCQESAYRFVEKVVVEVVNLYEAAGVPLNVVHTGGDEVPHGVWEKSPVCADFIARETSVNGVNDLSAYFIGRFNGILQKRNLITGGWEEIALKETRKGEQVIKTPNSAFVSRNFQPYVWNAIFGWGGEDIGYQLANAGYPVVLCNASNLYFDCAYDKSPYERGLYWPGYVNARKPFEFVPFDLFKTAQMNPFGTPLDPTALAAGKVALTPKGQQNILGIQAELWSETLNEEGLWEYYTFPKMIALAERAWAVQPAWATIEDDTQRFEALDKAWNQFANTVGQQEFAKLDQLFGGVAYRIEPPGAVTKGGKVHANTNFPGLEIRYTIDGNAPTTSDERYTQPLETSGVVRLKVFSRTGRGSRTVTIHL